MTARKTPAQTPAAKSALTKAKRRYERLLEEHEAMKAEQRIVRNAAVELYNVLIKMERQAAIRLPFHGYRERLDDMLAVFRIVPAP